MKTQAPFFPLQSPTRFFASSHAPIDFYFKKCARDFSVCEEPLYPFSGTGHHTILKVRKKDQSTWEMLSLFSQISGCKMADFGYAGLKDKQAISVQYISLPKIYTPALEKHAPTLHDHGIKILEINAHSHKIRLGHLKGNHFFMRLKKLKPLDVRKIEQVLDFLRVYGFPNYFGAQRFGKSGDNFKQSAPRSKKLNAFFLSSYQSHLFNHWLSARMRLNALLNHFSPKELCAEFPLGLDTLKAIKDQEHYFKLLEGDILCHYPFGKYFVHEDPLNCTRLLTQEIAPTGLLSGQKVAHAQKSAWSLECPYAHPLKAQGDRRYALVFPSEVRFSYISQEAQGKLEFFLPKGAYATIFLEEIAGRVLFSPKELA
ncbi:tRNA pseudouridine(13) synthase TruD [Helicobacter cynogastricus]|uniref:tRNA pseudouridine(13) synthase TruD n=1 Tax=Helicobacter cynogastricus TaxID=329937 RepID=UPI000CF07AD1|nr:tRNA pseudouridine(13) synthase TruD [Helicobacter cynogastricus]